MRYMFSVTDLKNAACIASNIISCKAKIKVKRLDERAAGFQILPTKTDVGISHFK